MAILVKGSRTINVDGCLYRWNVRRKPSHYQLIGGEMGLAVQAAHRAGAVLVVRLGHVHPGSALGMAGQVTPAVVRQHIRSALDLGWQPDAPGPAFYLRTIAGA